MDTSPLCTVLYNEPYMEVTVRSSVLENLVTSDRPSDLLNRVVQLFIEILGRARCVA